ncbi:DEAD/DEAH box helicase [Rhodococcus koreensis]|uniref:ATP-dependent helicase YprA, contains C-terminal metal-binding DUF1998 domain n=1 Tax=Rhodococcus koreensis TaxID=99653 RepID=A0A1H4I7M3_9NOCA|nr:DEAD/DEAH box helicase [Rhodococcus koreensis]SEB29973.1 ATP-dependent helicase YprA, contains C-terminal metal-binding DUF1998 domain [Rhodococcus koreensis]
MSELLPLAQAESIKHSLLDYLGTTFALADPDARRVLDEFLQHPNTGMFRGPYVRLRLPFRPAGEGWRDSLEWYEGFTPYGHQAVAFERLSSYRLSDERPRPLPTLVTTGTGSGKTEAFLYPILDHVQRAKRCGVTGTKAIILYPMNALANDQASRLTALLTERAALAGITAALYTGEVGEKRTRVTADGLITDRDVIRDLAPDILLTNYKMLDQLLLRTADADLWRQSAHSLQYLVLDEFHTYDGAQGTDVSMLLRRLGLTLKSHWAADDPAITAEDRGRPLGRITPVATSATLGDGGDPAAMLTFARTVFGEEFPTDSVVTESRLSIDDWVGEAPTSESVAGWRAASLDPARITDLAAATTGQDDPRALTLAVLRGLYDGGDAAALAAAVAGDGPLVLDLVKTHPVFHRLVALTRDAVHLDDLAPALFPGDTAREVRAAVLRTVTSALVGVLSHVRARHGRAAASVDVHLWTRELTRLDRAASGAPLFVWGDDGLRVDGVDPDLPTEPFLPAVYCRHCNRSGWGIALAPTGSDLDADDTTIRRRALRNDDRFRALMHAPGEAAELEAKLAEGATDRSEDEPSGLAWLLVDERRLTYKPPGEAILAEGRALPVLVHRSDSAGSDSVKDVCPACRQPEGIRFLGSAIATMLSVSLSTLFGSPDLDAREKRALVFTDSVQDAAHRAGFVQARSHALTLRTLLRQALADGESDLDSLVHRVIDLAGDDPGARYRVLPPELADRDAFREFWKRPSLARVPSKVRTNVRRRLLLDIQLELGLRSGVGRTLERTGTAVTRLDIAPTVLLACAREAVDSPDVQQGLFGPVDDARLLAWVRGVLERMRSRGAIEHEWFATFRQEDGNRWWITGGRRRGQGMPGFGRGNSAPGYPVLGGSARDTDLEPIASTRGWYAQWTAKALGVGRQEGAVLARLLFTRLRRRDVIGDTTSTSGAQTFHLPASAIVVRPVADTELASGAIALACTICRDVLHGAPEALRDLRDAPCLVDRCDGTLRPHQLEDNFYRQMYAATDIRRVVAREHTSLLPDDVRLEYETQFKQPTPPPNAPNVLVATPTLEMGIDIGDLSAVLLSSLPRSVASYLQRVGRAGRLTGNALALAYVTARGDQLPRFTRPEATINGAVRPPATYLDAEEILRRQFTASVADVLARRSGAPHPRTTADALRSTGSRTYLGALIAEAEGRATDLVGEFLAGFPALDADVAARLRAFPQPLTGPGTSELAARCHRASVEWNRRIEMLTHRKAAVDKALPDLQDRATSPAATEENRRDLRAAEAAKRLINRQLAELRSEYWVSALESFGLLPNYTLLDDTVTLSVSVNWLNPESQEYEHSEFELRRGSAQALRDFAPGSTFYANGFAIAIDAVDLGADGDAVTQWACCPACGYVKELSPDLAGADAPTRCPRCGSAAIADTSQRLPVAELRTVSAIIRREEATIDDSRDERNRERFTVLTAADIDPVHVGKRWFVEGVGFGAKHLRQMQIRWLNLGAAATGGGSRLLAGQEADAALFRVCSECGKLDAATGANRASEHRPWCSLRTAMEESTTSLALARRLTTEGLVLRLPPSVTLGDTFAMPSLAAAILLGVREYIGGDPDHLEITPTVDPSPHGADHAALLLHDVVPGGTGYLADFTKPDTVWDMLHRAWEVVKDCRCRDDGKLACENCLLPFAALPDVPRTSRSAAERHLANLLAGREFGPADEPEVPEMMPWSVTETEPEVTESESDLEKRFRVEFAKRLEALGATITEKPTDRGIMWDIALGSSNRWTLRPQENVLGSKPDFVLTSARGGVPPTAIFTDGRAYHATPAHNRIADDAEKRRNLRDGGYQVIAVTRDDVDGAVLDTSGFRANVTPVVLGLAGDQLSKSALDLVFGNAIDLLLAWIQQPSRHARGQLAHWLPILGLASLREVGRRAHGSPSALALAALDDGLDESPSGDTLVWRYGGFAAAIRLSPGSQSSTEVAVVLDDSDTALTEDAKSAWREWLRWANLLNFRSLPTEITSRTALSEALPVPVPAPTPVPAPEPQAPAGLTGPWLDVYNEVAASDRELVTLLAAAAAVPVPEVGEEFRGIPLEISWPDRKVVVDTGIDDTEREELSAAGWVLCPADPDAVKAALQEAGA